MENDKITMTDEEIIKDYPRLKLEYTRLHEDYRRLQSKQLTIPVSCEQLKDKETTVIEGFENYILKVHPDPDSVLIDNLERWKQIVLLAENYAKQ